VCGKLTTPENVVAVCRSVDILIEETKKNMAKKYVETNTRVAAALSTLPQTNTTDRRRRAADSAEQYVWDHIPSRVLGSAAAGLFDVPGLKALENLQNSLVSIAGAYAQQTNEIKQLGGFLSTMVQTSMRRTDDLERVGNMTVRNINNLRGNINAVYSTFANRLDNLSAELSMTTDIKRLLLTQVTPMLMAAETCATDTLFMAQTFEAGVIELLKGSITPALVPEDAVNEVIGYITTAVLTDNRWRGYGLISTAPSYYYRLQDIAFLRNDTYILLTMNFPLVQLSGRMPLYRVDILPVPLTAGLEETIEAGYTLIQNVPGFVAISEDTERFVELTTAQYLTCKGDVLKTCGHVGGGVLRDKNSMTCAFALFTDNHAAIKRLCDIAYTNAHITGRAVQLTDNGRYLTYNGGVREDWLLSCSGTNTPLQHISSCSYCQINLPCGCSLTAKHFLIPHSISNCAKTSKTTTTWYSRNTAMVTSVLSKEDVQNIRSYETSTNQLFPPFRVPSINFTRPSSEFYAFMEMSDRYESNYTHIIEVIKNNTPMFRDKVEAALSKARNFSDQVLYRAPDIAAAFYQMFTIFGNLGQFVTWLSSPVILAIIGFAIINFIFLPRCVPAVYYWLQDHQQQQTLTNQTVPLIDNKIDDWENYYSEEDDLYSYDNFETIPLRTK
jgi:hypothetical protein